MEIIDHGDWVRYQPTNYPIKNLPDSVLFSQRVSDGEDWYLYQRAKLAGLDSIKMTVSGASGRMVVQATANDASYLFPADQRVLEVVGADADHESFRQNVFDPVMRKFLPAPPEPVAKFEFLIALHGAGMLDRWTQYVSGADTPVRIALEADRPLSFDDRYLRIAARHFGWTDERLRQLFEAARKTTWPT